MHHLLHIVLEVLAFIVGYRYYAYLRGRQGDPIDEVGRTWIIIGAAAGALIGSRLLGALEEPSRLAWDLKAVFVALNNRTIVGGLLGGLAGVELTKALIGVRTSSGDLFTFPLLLGLMIGRVGCLFAGLEDNTYGTPTEVPWGIDLGDGVRRHPTNLYEILMLGLIWSLLVRVERRWTLKPGARFQVFMVLYLAFRLAVERIKPAPAVLGGLSTIQWAAVLGLLYYYRVWTRPRSLLARPAPLASSTDTGPAHG